jgi:hypothetical protein
VDRVREWAALIGCRNIAYVVVSLLVLFGMLMGAAGPQAPIPAADYGCHAAEEGGFIAVRLRLIRRR